MSRFVIAVLALAAGCRTRAVTTHYAGAPVAACAAGRAYQSPPPNSPTQEFIPLVAANTPTAPTPPPAEPPADTTAGGDSDAAADEAAEKTDKTAKKPAKTKKPAKKAKKPKKEAP